MSPTGEYTAHRNNCVLCVYVSSVQTMTAENQQEEGVERSRRQGKSIGARAAVPQVTVRAISAPGRGKQTQRLIIYHVSIRHQY